MIVRIIFLVVALLFAGSLTIWRQPCDGIDNIYLNCRITGSVGDVIGMILFFGGALVVSGIVEKLRFYDSENSVMWNLLAFVSMFVGAVLFWNL